MTKIDITAIEKTESGHYWIDFNRNGKHECCFVEPSGFIWYADNPDVLAAVYGEMPNKGFTNFYEFIKYLDEY